ncbi:MAG: hypothetical protein V4661_06285 [Pseudomonadota bacterium]
MTNKAWLKQYSGSQVTVSNQLQFMSISRHLDEITPKIHILGTLHGLPKHRALTEKLISLYQRYAIYA